MTAEERAAARELREQVRTLEARVEELQVDLADAGKECVDNEREKRKWRDRHDALMERYDRMQSESKLRATALCALLGLPSLPQIPSIYTTEPL